MNIIAIAVHPDDEIIGCGGTLLKHREFEDAVFLSVIHADEDRSGYPSIRIKEQFKSLKSSLFLFVILKIKSSFASLRVLP